MDLHHGDCLEIMRTLPDESIQLVLCDLPYGMTDNEWDIILPFDKLWEQYKRLMKPNGAIVLFGIQPFTSLLISSNLKMFKYEWVWMKNKGRGHLNAKKQPLRNKEDICVFYSKQCAYFPQMMEGSPYAIKGGSEIKKSNYNAILRSKIVNNGERYPNQILAFDCVPQTQILHPTQKPVELLEYLIKTYTMEADCVLDNCMGSGSTGVACQNTLRRFIGIEKDHTIFKIAETRLKNLSMNHLND